MERNIKYIYISRTTQRTNSGQVPACSQEPVDSTDANMVETSTCLETTQQEMTNFTVRYRSNRTGPCSAAPLSVQSSYRYQNILRIGEVLEHRIDAKISPKAASEKARTTVSENTYIFPNIDVFRTDILSLLAPTGNNARASFLVHQVPRTSSTVLWYRRMFTQFSLRVWVSEYTCRPMIANLLYKIKFVFFLLGSGSKSKSLWKSLLHVLWVDCWYYESPGALLIETFSVGVQTVS